MGYTHKGTETHAERNRKRSIMDQVSGRDMGWKEMGAGQR